MEDSLNNRTNAIDIRLRRHQNGVRVFVKVLPVVEEFFRRWGGGESEGPGGRLWQPMGSEKLQFWAFDSTREFNDQNYSLFHTGRPLWIDDGIVNLSMLRLVGASEGAKFMIDAVISRPELDRISARLVKAAESFYADYIQTVDIGICVSVRDLTLDR